MCPGSSDPSYLVNYYIKWVTNSWTYSTMNKYNVCFNQHISVYARLDRVLLSILVNIVLLKREIDLQRESEKQTNKQRQRYRKRQVGILTEGNWLTARDKYSAIDEINKKEIQQYI